MPSREPLESPKPDSLVLGMFREHFGIDVARETPPEELVGAVSRSFARIPYENLTKILRFDAVEGSVARARRDPIAVIGEHVHFGAGGTCFSLTATLLHILRALGLRAEPILADRKYGADTHCALLVWVDGEPRLVDPGYLLVDPITLDARERRVPTAFNEIRLVPRDGGDRVDLYTVQQGNRTYRLTFKTAPVDSGDFLRAWDASFDWEMMRYPVLTRVDGDRQLYLQERRVQVRDVDRVRRAEVSDDDLLTAITGDFGIDARLARCALEVLARTR